MQVSKVTLKDVAEHAGVSRSAASLALRGSNGLGPETRARILQAMDDLGYVYNRSAAAMREKSPRLIGLVVTSLENSLFAQSLEAIEETLSEAGYLSISASTLRSKQRQDQVLRQMLEFNVAGVILAAVEDTVLEAAEMLERAGVRCLSFTRMPETGSVDYVGPNDFEGGRRAAAHLLAHGAETFAFVGSATPSSASRLRQAGIEAELAAADRERSLSVLLTQMTAIGGLEAGRRLQADAALPDAIICVSDVVAFGLYDALRESHIDPLPRIIGFDDVELAAHWYPRLSTVSSHPADLGQMAAKTLIELLEHPQAKKRVRFLPSDLVVRNSCGCASVAQSFS